MLFSGNLEMLDVLFPTAGVGEADVSGIGIANCGLMLRGELLSFANDLFHNSLAILLYLSIPAYCFFLNLCYISY